MSEPTDYRCSFLTCCYSTEDYRDLAVHYHDSHENKDSREELE
jgi:hypothetical protein